MDKKKIIYNKLNEYLNDADAGLLARQESEDALIKREDEDYIAKTFHAIELMEKSAYNPAWRELKSNRLLGPIIIFLKKCVRKCLKWYIEPITIQQTNFNNDLVIGMRNLTLLVDDLTIDNANLYCHYRTLREMYDKLLEQELEQREKYNVLLDRIEKLENGEVKR